MRLLTILLLFLVLSLPTWAAEPPVTREEGFLLLWAPLKRGTEELRNALFTDIPVSHRSHAILTYAKARGILNDEATFFPDEPLRRNDALLWLLRSRNVAPPEEITEEVLPAMAERYGLAVEEGNPSVTQEELEAMMRLLDQKLQEELHAVSFYAEEFASDHTAFGEIFDPFALTAAHRTLPYNTLVRVRHEESGRNVTVRINDRGPYVEGRDMDLSLAAFEVLAPRSRGLLTGVTFERLDSAEIVAVCPEPRYRRRFGSILLSPGIPDRVSKGTILALTGNRSFRILQIRAPRAKPTRSRTWTRRGETLKIRFEKVGKYTFILHEDGGARRRFRTEVVDCGAGASPAL